METLREIPIRIWLVVAFFLFIPLVFEMMFYKNFETAWLLQLISIHLIITYLKSFGGIIICVSSILIHLIRIIIEENNPDEWTPHDIEIFLMVTIIKVVFTIISIYQHNRISQKQFELEILNKSLKKKSTKLKVMAYHDSLTGLPNRNMLYKHLKKALSRRKQNKQEIAIMFLDLDRFKLINDTLGHHIGDALLVQVTDRLLSIFRKRDIVARQGGDEFIIMLDMVEKDEVIQVAERILAGFSTPFILKNEEYIITPSIGISMFPHDGNDVETLIKNADSAMYCAKERKNSYRFFSAKNGDIINRRIKLENSLRTAISNNELRVYYQPQVELKTGDIKAVEALLRWNHPELGLISPMEFIPLAEETGHIIPIGKWVLETVCQQNKVWQESGFPSLRTAVNVSSVQFQNASFTEDIKGILRETRLAPEFLELEITESIMQDVKAVLPIIKKLKEIGVKISIDDFGTGYSSLNVLNHLPIDYLKIDQSFTKAVLSSPNTEAIVKTIIQMGLNMNFILIAEGVESKEQMEFLVQNHCQMGQGYLFSHPLPAEEIMSLLATKYEI
jgi:diguanylate cyclase (GGDEF)-like protein